MRTSMLRRLCSRAPLTSSHLERRAGGAARHRDRLLARQVLTGDRLLDLDDALRPDRCRRRRRRARRRPGPMSTIQSALADGLLVVLDDEHRVAEVAQARSSVSMSRRLSRWCRPIDGSSSTYSVPTRPEPIWLARRMRCASPPASVAADARQREVVEPDVEQEAEAGVDLLGDPLGDQPVALAELERGEELGATRRSPCRRPRRCCGR